MARGWFPVERAALADPLLNPGGALRPLEALLYLLSHADTTTNTMQTSVRALARAWEWDYSRTRRFLLGLAERGYIALDTETRAGVVLTVTRAWEEGRIRSESANESGFESEKTSNGADHHPSVNQGLNQGLNQERIRLGSLPPDNPPLYKEQKQDKTPNGRAHAREGGEPRPPESVTRFVASREAVQRGVELVRTMGLHGIELDGKLWEEQASHVRRMIEQHGEEATEQAIRGAGQTWPFKRDGSYTAAGVQQRFAACLATAAGAQRTGGGHGAGVALLERLGVSLPEHLEKKAVAKILGWVEQNAQAAEDLLAAATAKAGAHRQDQVGAFFAAACVERAKEENQVAEHREEKRQEKAGSEYEKWRNRVSRRFKRATTGPKRGDDYALVLRAAKDTTERMQSIPALERLTAAQKAEKRRELLLARYAELIDDPMPVR